MRAVRTTSDGAAVARPPCARCLCAVVRICGVGTAGKAVLQVCWRKGGVSEPVQATPTCAVH